MNSMTLTKYYQESQMEWQVHGIFSFSDDEGYKCFVSNPFSFADATWRLLLVGEMPHNPETAKLTLLCTEFCKYPVQYILSLKKVDGSVEQLDKGIMETHRKSCEHHFRKMSKVMQQRAEFAPLDVITVLCVLKAGTSYLSDSSSLEEPQCKRLKKLDTLSQNFHDLCSDERSCDTILCVQNREYKAHKAVLIARSKVFAAMFQHDSAEKQSGIITVPDCDPETFQNFLKFLYCGELEELTCSTALHLYQTSEKYNVQELKTFCTDHLIENLELDIWCDVVTIANTYNDEKLFSAAQDFFHKNLFGIFHTPKWEHLMKDNHQLACKLLKEIPDYKLQNDQ